MPCRAGGGARVRRPSRPTPTRSRTTGATSRTWGRPRRTWWCCPGRQRRCPRVLRICPRAPRAGDALRRAEREERRVDAGPRGSRPQRGADERDPEISTEDLVAVVEPGVVTGDLMKAVEAKGLFYPPDPNSWELVHAGREHRRERRRPARAQVRGHPRLRARDGVGDARRRGDPGGPAHHQGRGGLRPGGAASSAARGRSASPPRSRSSCSPCRARCRRRCWSSPTSGRRRER